MDDRSMGTLPPPTPLERIPRKRQSLMPVFLVIGLTLALIGGSAYLMSRQRLSTAPWRIAYPGIEWVRGQDSNTKEGKRFLQAEVRFDQDVLSAADFEPFLGELVKHTKNVYFYYHIRAQNKRGQHVLDGVADQTGRFTITPGPEYEEQ